MDVALFPLRQGGIRILNYLNDWLVCAVSKEQCRHHIARLLNHVQGLGRHLNHKKSRLEPFQVTTFLGIVLDSRRATVALTLERQQAFRTCLAPFQLHALGTLPSPYGLNGSLGAGGPPRPLTHTACAEMSARLGLVPSEVPQDQVVVSWRLHRALWWWTVPANIKLGRALGPVIYRQLV